MEFKTQPEVQDAIWKEVHQSRYHMAEEAPICQGRLRGEFGYSAEYIAAKQVLAGTCQFGEDFDKATKRFCKALANIREVVLEDSVDKVITREIWQQKWKGKEKKPLHLSQLCISDITSLEPTLLRFQIFTLCCEDIFGHCSRYCIR